jgi:tetratricopeptide (TPR) repeat protein
MNRSQWILVGFASVTLIGVYLFAKTHQAPTSQKAATHQHDEAEHTAFDIKDYLKTVKATVTSKDSTALFASAEKEFASLSANTQRASKAEAAIKLSNLYASIGDPLGNAYYYSEAAILMNKTPNWVESGDRFYSLVGRAPAEDIRTYLQEEALKAYTKALESDSSNINYKLKIAACYVEGGSNPMQGIAMLLDIVKKDSSNAEAQFMLGKFSMMSGQNEKAINRLEKVLHSQPQNLEAMFLLAQAYKSTGNKERAVKLFKQCRNLIENEEVQKEIDKYIEELNS